MNKKGEGVFGLSFGMIWSIILIVVFIFAAFYGIRVFLNYSDNSKIGIFLDGLKKDVNQAFYSENTNKPFTGVLPSGVEYVCLVNFSKSPNGNEIERMIYNELKREYNLDNNIYFYSPDKDYGISAANIKRIYFEKNPSCFKNIDGKVVIVLTKNYNEGFVRLG